MSKKITQDELESYLWGSAVLLRNHIDAGAYKQYIFPLLFFKRLNDVYEEEIRKTPKMDAVVETPDGEAVVCEVIPLAGLVRVKFLGNHSDMPPKLFHRDDVSVKGKMNWKSGTVTYLDEQK